MRSCIIFYILHLLNKFSVGEIFIISVHSGEFDTLVDHGNEAIHRVETIATHHNYRPDTYHNDIALIKLTKPIKFTRFILPACIPTPDFAEKVNL